MSVTWDPMGTSPNKVLGQLALALLCIVASRFQNKNKNKSSHNNRCSSHRLLHHHHLPKSRGRGREIECRIMHHASCVAVHGDVMRWDIVGLCQSSPEQSPDLRTPPPPWLLDGARCRPRVPAVPQSIPSAAPGCRMPIGRSPAHHLCTTYSRILPINILACQTYINV